MVATTVGNMSDQYVERCGTLQLKANSWVVQYLNAFSAPPPEAASQADTLPAGTDVMAPTTMDFSKTFLGKKGSLPLLEVLCGCSPTLTSVSFRNTGMTDYACAALAAALANHPSLTTLDLRGNIITSDAMPALKKMAASWKARRPCRAHTILIDAGFGVFEASIEALQCSGKEADEENAKSNVAKETEYIETSVETIANAKHTVNFSKRILTTELRLSQMRSLSKSTTKPVRLTSDGWLLLGVFVSTTYKDYGEEIKLLHHVILPRANSMLRRHKVQLVLSDLHAKSHLIDVDEAVAPAVAPGSLPPWRKGKAQHTADQGLIFDEEGAKISAIRSRALTSAGDIFVGFYSGMRAQEQAVDLENVRQLPEAVPMVALHRTTTGSPAAMLSRFDLKANISEQLLSTPPQEIDTVRNAQRELHRGFFADLAKVVPKCFTRQYSAEFQRMDANGVAVFNVPDIIVDGLVKDLFAIGTAYRSKKGMLAVKPLAQVAVTHPAPAAFPLAVVDEEESTKDEERVETEQPTEEKESHDDGPAKNDDLVRKSLVKEVLPLEDHYIVAVHGPCGSGKTTQLRKLYTACVTETLPVPTVVTHSVTHGELSLDAVLSSIINQLHSTAPFIGYHDGASSMESDHQAMVEDFLLSLEKVKVSKPLCVFIDDADVELDNGLSVQDFLLQPKVATAISNLKYSVRFFVTTTSAISVVDGFPTTIKVRSVDVPTFSEHEAASLIMHQLCDLGPISQRQVRRAAQFLVLQKEHGLRPLYCVLAAREMRYFNEGTSMVAIAEALPPSVPALARTVMRLGLPRDLQSAFVAISNASFPVTGHLLSYTVKPPAAAAADNRQWKWWTPRRWGRIRQAAPNAVSTLFFLLANFKHLFDESLDVGCILRQEWGFCSATVREAAMETFGFAKSGQSAATTTSTTPQPRGMLRFVGFGEETPSAQLDKSNSLQKQLKRLSYQRGAAAVMSLAHYPDTEMFKDQRGVHAVFALLQTGRIQELRRLINTLRSRKSAMDTSALECFHRFFTQAWRALLRHRLVLYSCPHLAPTDDLYDAMSQVTAASGVAHMKLIKTVDVDSTFELAQNQLPVGVVASNSSNTNNMESSTSSAAPPVITNGSKHGASKLIVTTSKVRGDFFTVHRGITAERHEVVPAMVSPANHPSFGYMTVMCAHKASECEPIVSRPHKNAISCVEIAELFNGSIRIATAAFFENEIVIQALVGLGTESAQLHTVGRYKLDITRPIITSIGVDVAPPSDGKPLDVDDAQYCPSVCVAKNNALVCFKEERYGQDNLLNLQHTVDHRVFTGHDSRIELQGFTPAGTKMFSIDGSGKCFVWGAPNAMDSDMSLAVTQLGSLPQAARFIDGDRILYVTNRSIALWNSSTSVVEQILDAPTRTPFHGDFHLYHYVPHIPSSREEQPAATLQRELLVQRESVEPTIPHHSIDGTVLYDEVKKSIRVFRRPHPPLDSDTLHDPVLMKLEERTELETEVPERSCDADAIGNPRPDKFKWTLHEQVAVAIDGDEGLVKLFDLEKNSQVPLFFGVLPEKVDGFPDDYKGPTSRTFEQIDSVGICGGEKANNDQAAPEHKKKIIVVADAEGNVHITDYVVGTIDYPQPKHTLYDH